MNSLSTDTMERLYAINTIFLKSFSLLYTLLFLSVELLYAEKFTSVNEREAIPHQSKNEWTTKTCADRMLLC